jgi:hypothetical protein
MTDTNDSLGFVPDFHAAWQNAWPTLRDDVEPLILVAFRVLVCFLDQHGFFSQPSFMDVQAQSKGPPQLIALLGTNDLTRVPEFANLVHAHLYQQNLNEAAELAFTIDEKFGQKLSTSLSRNDPTAWQNVSRAVNRANSVLMGEHSGPRPMILVRPLERYWSKLDPERVVAKFPLAPQGTATRFLHLLPTTSGLKHVHYSAVGSALKQRLTVALWPVKAPSIASRAITKSRAKNGRVPFYFKCWDDLPKKHQKEQTSLATSIADYIQHEARDDLDTVHIVAAPELTLATESLSSIIEAIETRRNAAWIVFPGSYHIRKQGGIINRAPVYLGGVLRQTDFAAGSPHTDTAAVKSIPVVFPDHHRKFVEEINGDESFTHLLDTSIGRIAVMICRDFLDDDLRTEVVRMDVDHLFVLSMSPDSGVKFRTAMDITSNYRSACFFVNAFTGKSPHAAHRAPLKKKKVKWMRKGTEKPYWSIDLKPQRRATK